MPTRLIDIQQSKLYPTLRALDEAGCTTEDFDWIRRGDNAKALLLQLRTLKNGNSWTLDEMIKAGHYDFVKDDFTEFFLSANPERFTTANTKIYHFNEWMSIEGIVAKMAKHDHEPAFIENLLAYGAEKPKEQCEYPIAALGSFSARGSSPYLSCHGKDRYLGLFKPEVVWSDTFRFLAVPKSAL